MPECLDYHACGDRVRVALANSFLCSTSAVYSPLLVAKIPPRPCTGAFSCTCPSLSSGPVSSQIFFSPSVKVEQTLRDVQTSRSRLRFLLLWLEQMSPVVTDSNSADGTEEHEPPSPCLTLANSVLTILREPLPSDKPSPSSRSTAAGASPRSRVSCCEFGVWQPRMRGERMR